MLFNLFRVGVVVGSALVSQPAGQGTVASLIAWDHMSRMFVPYFRVNDDSGPKTANSAGLPGNSSRPAPINIISSILSGIDEAVIREFRTAWKISGSGFMKREGVVLLYRMHDGSIKARSQGCSNEYMQFTFTWRPNVIAIVHTHPNDTDPQPTREDSRLADRFAVPIFTLTSQGMFVYDPATKKVSRLFKYLDWLKPPANIQASTGERDHTKKRFTVE